MVRQYALQTHRREMLAQYAAILTASRHMRAEYLKYDLPPERVHAVGLMIPQGGSAPRGLPPSVTAPSAEDVERSQLSLAWRLLFVARLTALKGGAVLLRTLRYLRRAYDGRIVLTVAGEGPERDALETQAAKLRSTLPNVEIEFAGWLGSAALSAALRAADLLVVPSVWPEPFGLVGAEAGIHGVPAAAFAVGGIPEWLREGINGHLAPGHPPTPRGLAAAIVRSLNDPSHHASLRAGALARARELSADRHIPRVIAILEQAARGGEAQRRTS
jgi:glycosyltransferase involved in cell wall biosynthesis